jgi:colanic acid/amylovoran biosynthesis glycosyltransferase
MRIAIIVGSFPELSTTFILDQVTGLLERGHDVQVFARVPTREEPVHPDFLRYRLAERTHYWWGAGQAGPLARRTFRLLRDDPRASAARIVRASNMFALGSYALVGRYWSYVAAMLCEEPFDVVLAQFGTLGRVAERLRRLGAFSAPLATVWRGYDLTRIVRERGPEHYRELVAHGDLMLPLSEHFRTLLRELGCPEHKLRIHHVGVDVERFAYSAPRLAPGEVVRIVTVCRLVEKKGLPFALQGLARARAEGAVFTYELIGDGPLRPQIEALRDQLGLGDCVTLHGPRTRDQVQEILKRSHLFLSPSVTAKDGDQEGTPTSIMEAMAVGLPVISTQHAGIPEVVRDGVSGFVVPEWDVDQLGARIAWLVAHGECFESFGREGRRIVERDFNLARLNDDLSQLLEELAGRGKAGFSARHESRRTQPPA